MFKLLPVATLLCATAVFTTWSAEHRVEAAQAATQNTAPPTMPIPADYREWIYLTSGLDMTYSTPGGAGQPADRHSTFDNVFVNPEAYRSFLKTGTWPDNTTLVLENREGVGNVSINKAGKTQSHDVTGLEIHRKLHGEWAFYVRASDGTEKLVAKPASCYTCHEQHAAVDTTFVQFYPTLLPVATGKHTLSDAYVHDPETRHDGK